MKKTCKFSIARKKSVNGLGKLTGLDQTDCTRGKSLANKELFPSSDQGSCGGPAMGPCGVIHQESVQGGQCGKIGNIAKMIKANPIQCPRHKFQF